MFGLLVLTEYVLGSALASMRQLAEAGGAIRPGRHVLIVSFGDNNQIAGLKIVNP